MSGFFIIKFDQEYKRTISAVIYEGRFSRIETKTMSSFDLKTYVANQASQVSDSNPAYKIITDQGNLAGYFVIKTGNIGQSGQIIQFVLRSNYEPFRSTIQQQVYDFVHNGGWKSDLLP